MPGIQRVGRLRDPLPQEPMDEGVLVVSVIAHLPGHGQAADGLLGGGTALGDVRRAGFGGKCEQRAAAVDTRVLSGTDARPVVARPAGGPESRVRNTTRTRMPGLRCENDRMGRYGNEFAEQPPRGHVLLRLP